MIEIPQEGLPLQISADPDQNRRWNAALHAVEQGQAKFISPDVIEFTPSGGFTPEHEARRLESYLELKHSYNEAAWRKNRDIIFY